MDSQTLYTSERRDARENHERILEAALQVFAERGNQAEIKDIAARAGVGVGTIYRHFESRDALLAALADRTHDEVIDRIRQGARDLPPLEAIRNIIITGLESIERFGALMEIMLEHQQRLDAVHERKHEEVEVIVRQIVERGVASGDFRPDLDPGILTATIEALFMSGKLEQLGAERGYRPAIDAVCGFLVRGCQCQPAS